MGTPGEEVTDLDLALIPRAVRDKLDRIGIKLHLQEWQRLAVSDRRGLCDWPCDSTGEIASYRARLIELVLAATGKPPDLLR
jgi:hypothetical protein